ncbi:MAG: ATPase [Sphingomonadaceae bacterium]|nr:ATPase [Sphingomonadaceae bacterium]
MEQITPFRVIVALLTTFGTAVAAFALGAPLSAAALAGAGGLVGGAILTYSVSRSPSELPVQTSENDRAVALNGEERGPTLEELMDALDDPTLLIEGRRVERANPAALKLLGDHIVGEDVRLAIRHPAAAELLVGERKQSTSRTSIELVGVGERERPWELIIHALSGNTRFARLADRSSTQAAEKMRVDFVANASHELRTPLSSLLGYIETLQDGAAKEKKTRKRFLEIMHSEASRMQSLIGDLMSLSRIEAEKYRLPDEQIDLQKLIEDACQTVCTTLGVDLSRVVIQGDANAGTLPGDHAQISQLVSNLVGNALKYSHGDTAVTVTTEALSDTMIRLIVKDEGEGISADHLPRLTERFYRVDPGRSRSIGGTGLGLAIVKHIVERHRGRLHIESVEGEGTTVTIDLPKNPGALSSRRNENVTEDAPTPLSATIESR